jgi:hypothetical protein
MQTPQSERGTEKLGDAIAAADEMIRAVAPNRTVRAWAPVLAGAR